MWAAQRSRAELALCRAPRRRCGHVLHAPAMAIPTFPTPSLRSPSAIVNMTRAICRRPLEYATIPAVAAFLGLATNWVGVKMMFYPIEYVGSEWYRPAPDSPGGLFGWQGVVPAKTERMASRLVDIITMRLLSLPQAFSRLCPQRTAELLIPAVDDAVRRDCGEAWAVALRPLLPWILSRAISEMQKEIEGILDLKSLVMTAFLRDKEMLIDLFQEVGRVELKFLVESGFGFGFALGLLQMAAWAALPRIWTLPAAGAVVGYITNWIAIKLVFEPAEPVHVGPIVVQGMFESRQAEVSNEFGGFLEKRVLSPACLLEGLASGGDDGELYSFLRRQFPYPVPASILSAAVSAIREAASQPEAYPELHEYMRKSLDIQATLSHRLQQLPPKDFEDLLHPVFKEDEITLIVVGGVLGGAAGLAQMGLGWGGPAAAVRALQTLAFVAVTSATFFLSSNGVLGQTELHDLAAGLAILLASSGSSL